MYKAQRLDILDVLAALQQVRQQDEVVDFARARRVERVKEGFGFGRHFVEIKQVQRTVGVRPREMLIFALRLGGVTFFWSVTFGLAVHALGAQPVFHSAMADTGLPG